MLKATMQRHIRQQICSGLATQSMVAKTVRSPAELLNGLVGSEHLPPAVMSLPCQPTTNDNGGRKIFRPYAGLVRGVSLWVPYTHHS